MYNSEDASVCQMRCDMLSNTISELVQACARGTCDLDQMQVRACAGTREHRAPPSHIFRGFWPHCLFEFLLEGLSQLTCTNARSFVCVSPAAAGFKL